jgi:hypothetical protein
VGVDDILTFSYRLRDIGANKGLLVTTSGFQAGVHKIAKAERIALLLAVKGCIVGHWDYFTCDMDFVQYGLASFTIDLAYDERDIRFIGKRYVSINTEWNAERLDGDSDIADSERIMFLPPEEGVFLSDEDLQNINRVGWGRRLGSISVWDVPRNFNIPGEEIVLV